MPCLQSPSSRQSNPIVRGLSSIELFPFGTTEQRHRPIRAPPFQANRSESVVPPSSNRTNSFRPNPSGLDDAFLDSNEAGIRESRGANEEEDVESLGTYRDDAPFDSRRTPSDLAVDRALSSTRTSTCPDPSVTLSSPRKARLTQLVYENEDQVQQSSFGTYHGGFPSGTTVPNPSHIALAAAPSL